MKWLLLLLLLLGSLCTSRASAAHELRPGALSVRELEPGRYALQWSPPTLAQGVGLSAEPVFPAHCRIIGDRLDCGDRGLEGTIAFPALAGSLSRVVVHVQRRDGTSTTAVLSGDSPSLVVRGTGTFTSTGAGTGTEVVAQYTALGIEHILSGVDHLLFVLGLLLLVGFRRRLVVTITAFTLAHSVTLAAAVLGLARVPQAPVEAVIALSILLLAVECSKKADSLARRAPWAVAFSFGLLHGFGFAGALSNVGLPRDHVAVALLCFNVGVELGQLMVIVTAYLLTRLLGARLEKAPVLETAAVYAIGALAAFWSIERTLAALT